MSVLASHGFMENPQHVLETLRKEGPLVRQHIPFLGKVWMTTTSEAANQMLKADALFTQRNLKGQLTGLQWWMPKSLRLLGDNMLGADGADHTRLRSAVDVAFARRDILQMEAKMEVLAQRFIAPFIAKGANGEARDFTSEIARPFPLAIIAELLGLPDEDHERFMVWGERITNPSSIWGIVALFPALKKMIDYLRMRIEQCKPSDAGLIAALAHNEDGQLTDDEIVSMVFLLLVAGFETTTHLLAGGMLAFGQNPEQRKLFQSDPNSHALAIEECLRFVSPVMMTNPRVAREDTEICGAPIKRGERVMALIVGSNYDPSIFDAPEVFDITRSPNRHMSFGTGVHFCLGHQLARLEAKVMFKAFFDAAPNWQLANQKPEYRTRIGIRALKSLNIKV